MSAGFMFPGQKSSPLYVCQFTNHVHPTAERTTSTACGSWSNRVWWMSLPNSTHLLQMTVTWTHCKLCLLVLIKCKHPWVVILGLIVSSVVQPLFGGNEPHVNISSFIHCTQIGNRCYGLFRCITEPIEFSTNWLLLSHEVSPGDI